MQDLRSSTQADAIILRQILTSTSLTNAPSPRSGQGSVWTGTEMIVWGGLSGNSEINTGARYNPSSNS